MNKTPIHLWIIGVLSLIWNAGGAFDYVMTKFSVASYIEALPEAALRMVQEAPLWFDAAWAVGVWFSVLGSLLLLARARFAGTAFALSFIGLIVASVYNYGLSDGASMLAVGGTAAMIIAMAVPVVLILLWIYARAMTRRGVLR